MKHFKTIFMVFFVFGFALGATDAAGQLLKQKEQLPLLIKVELEATAKKYIGVCPITVKMTGTITVPKAMTVQYHFLRSDGALQRLIPLVFRAAGSQTVPFSWMLGKDYQGWVQLVVKADQLEFKSERIEFIVDCEEKETIKPSIKIFDWKMAKIPEKIKVREFTLEKITRSYNKKPAVDLVVSEVKVIPPVIFWYQPIRVYVRIENHGMNPSPMCKILLTLKSAIKNQNTGNDTFDFMYNLVPLPAGFAGWKYEDFHNFWPCIWTVTAKADATGIIPEGFYEGNNTSQTTFQVK